MKATDSDPWESEPVRAMERLTQGEFFHRGLIFVAVTLFLTLLWQSTEVILLIFADFGYLYF